MTDDWNNCRRCHSVTHELQIVTADLRRLIRRAEKGANVAAEMKVKQDAARQCRTEIEGHKALGVDQPHPVWDAA